MKVNFSKSVFANFATSMNIFSGFLSIIYSGNGDYFFASLFIFSAAFFDLFDGLIARLTKTSSKFGVELDSLGDVVSFGAAPSYLLYKTYFFHLGISGIILSSFILIFGAFRLARFNIQLEDITKKHDFTGLPIPFSAVAIASIVLFYFNGISYTGIIEKFLIPIVLLLSFLMVSSIRYNAWPKLNKMSLSGKIIVITFAFIAIVLIYLTAGKAFLYLIAINILFGIARHIFYGMSFLKNSQLKLKEKTN
jgi:CDP-diacylglycerol--serine O-phosphatidyltransferase